MRMLFPELVLGDRVAGRSAASVDPICDPDRCWITCEPGAHGACRELPDRRGAGDRAALFIADGAMTGVRVRAIARAELRAASSGARLGACSPGRAARRAWMADRFESDPRPVGVRAGHRRFATAFGRGAPVGREASLVVSRFLRA